jgi:1-acyl-sn-glycerol-3-phosphate acyltransferase
MSLWVRAGWLLLAAAVLLAVFVAALPVVIRPILRAMLSVRYNFRLRGQEHVPRSGPVVFVANHVSWIDGFIIAAISPRDGRALVNSAYLAMPVLRWLATRAGMIPVPTAGPHGQRVAITAVRAALDRGQGVLIFPEAQISRNGFMGSFYRGLEVMLVRHESVPVVPVYLANLWGSIFSFSDGKFFRKRPRGWRRTVVVVFGEPVPPPVTVFSARQGMTVAAVRAAEAYPLAALGTIDLSLPHLEHPQLGVLAVSTPDFDDGHIRQTGQKPGSVGQAAPGVALRAVDENDNPLPADATGKLKALIKGQAEWADSGLRGRIDRDGFVWLESAGA